MGRKKTEIALQVEIETQEEWEETLAKEGVTVVDVYPEWAGPCKAMVSFFRKVKTELGDDLLRFAIAKSDSVDSLERYRGSCQPCFLFYAGGVLVHVQRGAVVPAILKAINDHLKNEHKVLNGSAERKEVTDPVFENQRDEGRGQADDDDDDDGGKERHEKALVDCLTTSTLTMLYSRDDDSEGGGEIVHYDDLPELADANKKAVTIAILKPNVVKEGKVDEIIEKMEEHGIEILERDERTLTKDEVQEFYAHKKDEEFFDDMCEFMSSGPSVVLVLSKGETGKGIIDEWRDLLGPANVEEAKENAPESLRAQFGAESFVNAVHGSDSGELAMQELAFFFPNYTIPGIAMPGRTKNRIQRTLALIRPDALRDSKDEILAKIEEAGFMVAMQKEMQLTKEQAEEFYKEHAEQPYFDELVTGMTSGPLLALALARDDAVTGWRELLGPKELDVAKTEAPDSLRAQFSVEDVPINQIHGSDTQVNAEKELNYFFPMQQTVAVIKSDEYQTRDEIMNKIKQAGFHIAARKETDVTTEVAEQFYGDLKDKEYFGDLVHHMTSGPTLFMVLSREDAVEGWRGLAAPTDPTVEKEEDTEVLRAQFGSSTTQVAKSNIDLVFGTLDFHTDGTLKEAEKEEEQETVQQEEEPAAEVNAYKEDSQRNASPIVSTGRRVSKDQPRSGSRRGSKSSDAEQYNSARRGSTGSRASQKGRKEKSPSSSRTSMHNEADRNQDERQSTGDKEAIEKTKEANRPSSRGSTFSKHSKSQSRPQSSERTDPELQHQSRRASRDAAITDAMAEKVPSHPASQETSVKSRPPSGAGSRPGSGSSGKKSPLANRPPSLMGRGSRPGSGTGSIGGGSRPGSGSSQKGPMKADHSIIAAMQSAFDNDAENPEQKDDEAGARQSRDNLHDEDEEVKPESRASNYSQKFEQEEKMPSEEEQQAQKEGKPPRPTTSKSRRSVSSNVDESDNKEVKPEGATEEAAVEDTPKAEEENSADAIKESAEDTTGKPDGDKAATTEVRMDEMELEPDVVANEGSDQAAAEEAEPVVAEEAKESSSAPGTPAPGTPAPGIPAHGTPAPATPAPGTPAPGTPAPGTPAPGTPAPGTPAPGTPAPATPVPEEAAKEEEPAAEEQKPEEDAEKPKTPIPDEEQKTEDP